MLKTILAITIGFSFSAHAATDYNKISEQSIELLRELVKTETVGKNEDKVVALIKKRLDTAKIPYEITEFEKGRKNIVARLKGNGSKKPMLIVAHSDVVPTADQKWDTPPHVLTEKDGYLYGRGVMDDLGYAAIATELLIEMKNNKTPLDRDVILAITGDEEKGGAGMRYLLAKHRSSIDAEFALNEGAATMTDENGKPAYSMVSAAEKTYQDFKVTTSGPPGHSSMPQAENAIYRISGALDKLGKHKEPVIILPVVENFFKGRAQIETDPKIKAAMLAVAKNPKNPPKSAIAALEARPNLNALLRTTCVATVLRSSEFTMRNVLPAQAEANVNCRILPGVKVADIEKTLATIFKDPNVKIERISEFGESDASSLDSPVMKAAVKVAQELHPGIPVMSSLLPGATDSRYLRAAGIPAYGISPIFITDQDRLRAHAANERLRKSTIPAGAEYFHKLILELAASPKN